MSCEYKPQKNAHFGLSEPGGIHDYGGGRATAARTTTARRRNSRIPGRNRCRPCSANGKKKIKRKIILYLAVRHRLRQSLARRSTSPPPPPPGNGYRMRCRALLSKRRRAKNSYRSRRFATPVETDKKPTTYSVFPTRLNVPSSLLSAPGRNSVVRSLRTRRRNAVHSPVGFPPSLPRTSRPQSCLPRASLTAGRLYPGTFMSAPYATAVAAAQPKLPGKTRYRRTVVLP